MNHTNEKHTATLLVFGRKEHDDHGESLDFSQVPQMIKAVFTGPEM